jgi:hypothetical protein
VYVGVLVRASFCIAFVLSECKDSQSFCMRYETFCQRLYVWLCCSSFNRLNCSRNQDVVVSHEGLSKTLCVCECLCECVFECIRVLLIFALGRSRACHCAPSTSVVDTI